MSFVCDSVFEFIIFLSNSVLYSTTFSISSLKSPMSVVVFMFCVLILRSTSEILTDVSSFLLSNFTIKLFTSEILV